MTNSSLKQTHTSLIILLGVIGLFIIGRLWGGDLFTNHWSFNHWQHLPATYPAVWAVVFVGLVILLWKLAGPLAKVFTSRAGTALGLVILLVLTIVFRFDSFVYGGGNLRIAQIAQADTVIYRWFEFGTVLITSWLYGFFMLFVEKDIDGGLMAWQTLTFIGTAFSLVGAAKLAADLTVDTERRLLLFLTVFFGSQTLLYFGFVGVEPIIVPVIIWFSLYALRVGERQSLPALGMLWAVTVLGIFLHASLLLLLPATMFLTVATFVPSGNARPIGLALGLVTLAGLLIIIYSRASQSLEFTTYLLFLEGKRPRTDYGIFSGRHLGDILQLLFLAAPLLIALKGTSLTFFRRMWASSGLMAIWLLALGCFTVLLVLDPKQSIVLDFPRLIAYLTPCSILLALMIRENLPGVASPKLWLGLIAAASIMLPLSYYPSYASIEKSESYVTNYMDQHDTFYELTCLAYRDNYFQRKEFSDADRWEWKMPTVSPDYLNLQGTGNLIAHGQHDDAITVLYNLIAKNPYYTGPRIKLIAIQMQLSRLNLAKPQIDTCLMLEPYRREHHIHLYSYYRNSGRTADALRTVENALEIFPTDPEILTDKMLLNFRLGNVVTADSLAHSLNESDSTLPFPHLMLGMIEEVKNNPRGAIPYFEKFLELAPEEPEAPIIQVRLDSLLVRFPEAAGGSD